MDTATRNEVKRFSQEWGARFTRAAWEAVLLQRRSLLVEIQGVLRKLRRKVLVAFTGTMAMTLDPPAAVKRAIESWADIGPFTRKPMQPGESSFIFDWGVRVEYTEGTKTKIGYICLVDEYCRRTDTADNFGMSHRVAPEPVCDTVSLHYRRRQSGGRNLQCLYCVNRETVVASVSEVPKATFGFEESSEKVETPEGSVQARYVRDGYRNVCHRRARRTRR
ncbi:hypothetical protein GQ600_11970 [Phytophthora cactorum]|nr:hypothetical protein GQ600_11970 [Phytophthora cactorum]